MQDNPNAGEYNVPSQNSPYDDQITVPAPQGQAIPPFSYNQVPGDAQPAYVPPATVPQRKRPVSKKILIGGAIILVLLILGIAGAVLVPRLTTNANNQAATSTPAASTPAAKPVAKNIYAPYLTQYREGIRSQIAQNLHLSTTQLETQLSAGQTLSSIATAQHVSNTQLQTIVTNAFQTGFQPAVNSGNLTQKQVDLLVKRMLKQPKTLDRFLIVQARVRKGANATPTAVSQ